MKSVEVAVLLAAVLGFVGREAMAIASGIKGNENSPDTFSLRYYLSRSKNVALLVSNACGTGILLLARHEVLGLAGSIPFVSQYLGSGTPVLVGGTIGFTGAHVLRWIAKKFTSDTSDQDGQQP